MKAQRTYKRGKLADRKEPRKKRVRNAFQIAALVYRWNRDRLEILLVTSRVARRWILPKGWPIDRKTPAATAMQEAEEEAGVIGHAAKKPIGRYTSIKKIGEAELTCEVEVYPLEFLKQKLKWKERGERVSRWLAPDQAVAALAEPELAAIIRGFAADMHQPDKVRRSA